MRRSQGLPLPLVGLHPSLPRPRHGLRVFRGADPLARICVQVREEPSRRPGGGLEKNQEPLEAKAHDRQDVAGEFL